MTPDAKVLEYVRIRPEGQTVADSRIFNITVKNALEERLGWDDKHRLGDVYKEFESWAKSHPPTIDEAIAFMLTRPLQFEPGEKNLGDGFANLLLYKVAEKAAGKNFAAILKDVLEECGPTHVGPSLPEDRAGDEEVWGAPLSLRITPWISADGTRRPRST